VDLSSLNITYWGRTLLNGATIGDPSTKLVGFPKWTNSLISDLDIWIGNRNVQNFPLYGWVYALYADYKSNYASKCKEIGVNSDPSVYTFLTDSGAVYKHNTYAANADAGLTANQRQAINSSQGFYSWNEFMGFLNSVKIIDTKLLGAIEIHIRLNPASSRLS